MERFNQLLTEFGAELKQPLAPDKHDNCLLQLEGDLQCWLRPEPESEDLFIAIQVGHLGPGKGREKLFRAALMHNNVRLPFAGRFAFSRPADNLVLFERVNMYQTSGQQLFKIFTNLVAKSKVWKEAIRSGQTPEAPYKGALGG